tara:strand:- start:34 stop:711 length:678 start_codon:yes stop_codon:yes gene_type:complete
MKDKTKNIYQKLAEIQSQIIGLGKDKQAFGYKYVTGDKILGLIKPIMVTEGLILKQEILSIDNEVINYTSKNGASKELKTDDEYVIIQKRLEDKTEVLTKVMMRFTWVDIATGETDVNLFGANGQNGFDKGVGSALTYAERYFLLKYFHIATDEDDIDQPQPEELTPIQVEAKKDNTIYTLSTVDVQAWNGKIYENHFVYVGKDKKRVSKEQLAKLKKLPKYTKS